MFFRPRHGIAVEVGVNAIRTAEYRLGKGGAEPLWRKAFALSPEGGMQQSLRDAACHVARQIGRRYVPLNIVLGDTHVRSKTLSVDAALRNDEEIARYVRWRFAEEEYIDTAAMNCTYQLVKNANTHQVFAQLCDSHLLDALQQAFQAEGIAIATIRPAYNYLHNHPRKHEDNSPTVLLHIGHDSWGFAFRREDGLPLIINAQPLDSSAMPDEPEGYNRMFRQVERFAIKARAGGLLADDEPVTLHLYANREHLDGVRSCLSEPAALDAAALKVGKVEVEAMDMLQMAVEQQ